jgi:hypothetical protein
VTVTVTVTVTASVTVTAENRRTHGQTCCKAILYTRNLAWTRNRLGRNTGVFGERATITA